MAAIGALPVARPRSPLEQSPGYYPPDDPESMSVITGRREAKPVSLAFTGGAAGREDLARMILAALNARDVRAIHALRVTKDEFGAILWPEFPESRPVTHISLDDAWLLNLAQSAGGVSHTVGSYGGRDLGLVAVECDPGHEYTNFALYRNVVIVARDQVTGDVLRLRFAPSFAERLGRFKVLTYRD